MSLTEDFISNLKKEFNLAKNKILTLRYKQRLAGLINFARHILKLPLSLVSMGFYHPDKLTSLASKFHSNEIKFFASTSLRKVWCDATPQQIGIYSERFYEHLINMLQNVEHIANNIFNFSFINI